jgi:hypothetical protein
VFQPELTAEERAGLEKSAQALRTALKGIGGY